jgi:hypothetical protein
MNRCLFGLSSPFPLTLAAEAAERGDPGSLSIRIVVGNDKSGSPTDCCWNTAPR